jgi:hypothetical protein
LVPNSFSAKKWDQVTVYAAFAEPVKIAVQQLLLLSQLPLSKKLLSLPLLLQDAALALPDPRLPRQPTLQTTKRP